MRKKGSVAERINSIKDEGVLVFLTDNPNSLMAGFCKKDRFDFELEVRKASVIIKDRLFRGVLVKPKEGGKPFNQKKLRKEAQSSYKGEKLVFIVGKDFSPLPRGLKRVQVLTKNGLSVGVTKYEIE